MPFQDYRNCTTIFFSLESNC